MTLSLSGRDSPELKQRWRQQLASQQRRRLGQGPRPLAAVTHLVRGQLQDGLIDVRHLSFIVLHDQQGGDEIRCAGYGATSVPWGLKIGGADNCKFDKDLAIAPGPKAKGRRFDSANGELLELVLNLDQLLERHGRYPHFPRRQQLQWPTLWAAFAPSVASQIQWSGPEFDSDKRRENHFVDASLVRTAPGLALYPLPYVSHAWREILVIFADLTTIPKRQVIALEPHARNLRGHEGAVEFDLLSSRFPTSAAVRRRTTTRRHTTAMLAS